jgi:hypothetical protein
MKGLDICDDAEKRYLLFVAGPGKLGKEQLALAGGCMRLCMRAAKD